MDETDSRTSRAEAVVASVGVLPTLPHVATRIMALVNAPKSTAKDLEQVISRDQATTAKVLRVANSAYFGARGQVSTLRRAIVTIGFNSLRSLALAGVTEMLHRGKRSCFKEMILWEHSVATALAARMIARECRYAEPEEAYVGGLLHDIGKVVMDTNLPEQYQQVMDRVCNDGQTFIDAENEVFGFNHTDVGALVLKDWGLATELREAVELHHEPLRAKVDPVLCAVVSLANALCVKLGIGPERDPELELTDLQELLTLTPEQIERIRTAFQEDLAKEKSLLSVG